MSSVKSNQKIFCSKKKYCNKENSTQRIIVNNKVNNTVEKGLLCNGPDSRFVIENY